MKHMRLYTYIFINNSLNIIERHLRCYINKPHAGWVRANPNSKPPILRVGSLG